MGSFVGGKLRLKGDGGGGLLKKKKKKKKSKRKESRQVVTGGEDERDGGLPSTSGYSIKNDRTADKRTEAEKRFDEVLTRREKEEIEKAAGKTHRDKVKEFNEKLAN